MRTKYFLEIDLLRGIAVVMMVVNHAGFGLMSEAALATAVGQSFVVFGSFAPVLFFFTTGVGFGIQHSQGQKAKHVFWKVLILFAADAIMTLYFTGRLGFDFLAFIGLSTLICAQISRSQYAFWLSLVGFFAIAGLRFVIGPLVRDGPVLDGMHIPNAILGTYAVAGISYALAPWLCFPLIGFCIGQVLNKNSNQSPKKLQRVYCLLGLCGTVLIVAGCALVARNAVFARYATVSLAFFVVALGAAMLSLSTSGLIEKAGTVMRCSFNWLRTRGVACLAVVPIHYLIIGLMKQNGIQSFSRATFSILVFLLVPLCIWLGGQFEDLSAIVVAAVKREWMIVSTVVVSSFV